MIIRTGTEKLIEQMQLYDKKSGRWIQFVLWPAQRVFLKLLHSCKKIIELKKRQVGMSQLTGADSLAQCMLNDNFTVLILSKTGDDAKEYLKRVSGMYNSLPKAIRDAAPIKKDGVEEIEFINGSRIKSLPANRGAGMTADRVVIDEAAFITKRDAHIELEMVLMRVAPTLDKAEGQLILISTANGFNEFQRIYEQGKRLVSGWVSHFFSCWDDPTFSAEKRQAIIDDFGEAHANQEYPRTDDEAFLHSGRPRFNLLIVNQYKKAPCIFRGNITKHGIEENPNGYIHFYKKFDRDDQYLITGDVSEGLPHGDNSVLGVRSRITWEVIAKWFGHIEPKELGKQMYLLGLHYNKAVLAPEANNHGLTVISTLRDMGYPEEKLHVSKLSSKELYQDRNIDPSKRYGWHTTSKTKPLIIDGLAHLVTRNDIPYITEEERSEMNKYVVGDNGSTNAESGNWDDHVMEMAIGYHLLPQYPPEIRAREHYRANSYDPRNNPDNMVGGYRPALKRR